MHVVLESKLEKSQEEKQSKHEREMPERRAMAAGGVAKRKGRGEGKTGGNWQLRRKSSVT